MQRRMSAIIPSRLVLVGMLALVWTPLATAADADRPLTVLAPGAVRLSGELGRRVDLTIHGNLLKLDVDRNFLAPLKAQKGDYIGVGILLQATCDLAAHTEDPRLSALAERVARALVAAQEPDGYIGYKPQGQRVWKLFDPDEIAQIVLGLVRHYELTRAKPSLEAARRLAALVIRECRAHPQKVAHPPFGDAMFWICMDLAMMRLYEASRDPAILAFCVADRKLAEWNLPIVLGRWGPLDGHAYAYLARATAQLHLYRIRPEPRLLETTHRTVDFLLRGDGLVITGAVSDWECWHDNQDGTRGLGETCATSYLLDVLDDSLRREKTAIYGDLMDRVIWNTLLAAQSADGRRLRYYTPFEGRRAYHPNDFFCCPNNFRRAMAKLPSMIAYGVEGGLAVNLYTASTIRCRAADVPVTVRQETDYPNSGRVTLHLAPERPAEFPLWLRIPRWCVGAKARINGQPVARPVDSGTFLVLNRTWQSGDRVELELPMTWRWIKGRQSQAGRAALMRGPMVFCVNRDRQPALSGVDLRQLKIDPASNVEGPLPDDSVRPGGMKARIRAWVDNFGRKEIPLELTEFADVGGESVYFKVANPQAAQLADDELLGAGRDQAPASRGQAACGTTTMNHDRPSR